MNHLCIDGISCRTGDIGYDHTVLTDQLIDDRRFSYIRLADDGDPRAVILLVTILILGKIACHNI